MIKTIIVFLLIYSCLAVAQERLTFENALAIALKSNHQIEMARNNAEMADNNASMGNADLLPSFSLTSGADYSDGNSGFGEDGPSTQTSARISASYTLFDGFGNIYRFKELVAQKKASQLEARDLIESALLQVSQAFYSAASAWENYQIAEELLEISHERLKRAQERAAYGRAMTLDVLAANVDLSSDSVTVTQARFAWDETRRGLNVLLNRDVNTDFLVDTTASFQKDFSLPSLKSQAFARNAFYLATGERLKSAKNDLRAAWSAHLPRLDLSGSYNLSQSRADWAVALNDPSKSFNAGVSLSFTLFDGFKKHIRRQNAQISLRNQTLVQEQARLNLEKDVTSAYEAFRNSLLVLNLETKSLEAAQLNFQRTRELYQLGQVTTTQFREAQLNLIRAKSNLSAAKYEAKLSEIGLMQLSGVLLDEGGEVE